MCEKHNGYYAIECPGNLYWLAEQVNAGNTAINAVLASNIVINGTLEYDETDANNALQWTPIGYYNSANDKLLYSGNFDGNGKTIRGLCIIDTSCNYVGLFGANGGKIENLGIVESHGNKRSSRLLQKSRFFSECHLKIRHYHRAGNSVQSIQKAS